ncbi:MAG: hypothetical protein OEV40_14795 [Acidimicrobiia bacterium]|nr:hypothetical protein [Acidimicrobiia bacterium]
MGAGKTPLAGFLGLSLEEESARRSVPAESGPSDEDVGLEAFGPWLFVTFDA